MVRPLEIVVRDYEWIHLSVGLVGHVGFLVGSVLFLPALEQFKTIGVWLFIIGAGAMLIGYVGRALVDVYERRENQNKSGRA